MNEKYLVYILFENGDMDVGICDTRAEAVSLAQKTNEYITSLPNIKDKITEENLTTFLDTYPELENGKYNQFLQNNKNYSKLDIVKAIDYYSFRFKDYCGTYIRNIKYFSPNQQIQYEEIF